MRKAWPHTFLLQVSLTSGNSLVGYVKTMLKEGENPKPQLIEDCKPQCKYWKEKLERCET
jgi:hypothetical protein